MENVYSSALAQSFTSAMIVFVLFFLPFFLSGRICHNRNRSVLKGLFVTLFTFWIGTAGLWLALRRRDPQTKQLF